MHEVVLFLLEVLLALFLDLLASLAVKHQLVAGDLVLLDLLEQLLLCRCQLLDVFLPACDLLVKLAQVVGRILHRVPVLIQSALRLGYLLQDLIELFLQLPVLAAAYFHDLGLLGLLLPFELFNLWVQVGERVVVLSHLAPVHLDFGDLLLELSAVIG